MDGTIDEKGRGVMGIEREWKFQATPELLNEVQANGAEHTMQKSVATIDMQTTYLDTAERDFAGRRWTLRVRRENGRPVVTLKTPASMGARAEWEHPGDVPDAEKLIALGAPEELRTLLQKPLETVCGARFTRRAILLGFAGAGLAELALDEGVLFRGERSAPLCEIELEHKAGKAADTMLLASMLKARYDLQPEPESKFLRASRL